VFWPGIVVSKGLLLGTGSEFLSPPVGICCGLSSCDWMDGVSIWSGTGIGTMGCGDTDGWSSS
jgi:hypothetical protein